MEKYRVVNKDGRLETEPLEKMSVNLNGKDLKFTYDKNNDEIFIISAEGQENDDVIVVIHTNSKPPYLYAGVYFTINNRIRWLPPDHMQDYMEGYSCLYGAQYTPEDKLDIELSMKNIKILNDVPGFDLSRHLLFSKRQIDYLPSGSYEVYVFLSDER